MDNPDVQKQFEDYFDLFSRPGWALLMEDLESMIENLDSLEYVDSLEKLQYHKGQLTILRRIVGMRQAMDAAYEDFDEESDFR
jgi:hypothetical protein